MEDPGTKATVVLNKTVSTGLGTFFMFEIMHEVLEGAEAGLENSHGLTTRPHGVPGEQVIFLCILFRMFLTVGRGGLTALITVALRIGMHVETQEGAEPSPAAGQMGGLMRDAPPARGPWRSAPRTRQCQKLLRSMKRLSIPSDKREDQLRP